MTVDDTGVIREVPTINHFGPYLARTDGVRTFGLRAAGQDPDPSPIGEGVPSTLHAPSRLTMPLIRRGWLRDGPGGPRRGGARRGDDVYVEVGWDETIDLLAAEIERVRIDFGNEAIYGGSYGWGSAGRFHHPQSQIHRFLNLIGGYTASTESYSSAAMQVILRRVAGGYAAALASNPTWDEIAEHRSLVIAFGGLAARNSQVDGGGIGAHRNVLSQREAAAAGAEFVVVSPLREDVDPQVRAQWLSAVPGSDVAFMLALAHELVRLDAVDRDFLDRYTVGWDRFQEYLLGDTDGIPKTPEWAAPLTGVPADEIVRLAARIPGRRTVFTTSYSLQRADHGEQAPWMALTLALLTGNQGRPGGGFGAALGALHQLGLPGSGFKAAAFEQGTRPITSFIPVARIADMLLHPNETFDYDGGVYSYPDIKLVYWAGGNPFHHHQDLNRLVRAWQEPDTIVVHDHFANSLARHADIVLPAATWLERDDFAVGADGWVSAIVRAAQPPGDVRTDYAIFSALAARLGIGDEFTEGRSEGEWVAELYDRTRVRAVEAGVDLPGLDELRRIGAVQVTGVPVPTPPYRKLLEDPAAHPLATPSGRFEIFSETIASFGYDDCHGHPTWFEPQEWAGAPLAADFPLHLISGQPDRRLHSQYDNGSHSRAGKVADREPILLNTADAAARGISAGDIVRVHNDRGQLLAGAVVTDDIRPGVVRLSTGAWYDPITPGGLDVHGNPNVVTGDRGTSGLAQGPSAHSTLVQVERFEGAPPPIRVFDGMPLGER